MTDRLRFFLEVAAARPKPCCALKAERPHAQALVHMGLLKDVDETDPGCFAMTIEGEEMLFLLVKTLSDPMPKASAPTAGPAPAAVERSGSVR